MEYTLLDLPFPKKSLAPFMSEETLNFHHGKHHKEYVEKLSSLIKGTKYENLPLVDIIKQSNGAIFNNAAQTWNHDFFWNCLTPEKHQMPSKLHEMIRLNFNSIDAFEKEFVQKGTEHFASGWIWLVTEGNHLKIITTANAQNPLKEGKRAILTCDLWEHAYYLDYKNERSRFIEAFFKIVNWNFAEKNLTASLKNAA